MAYPWASYGGFQFKRDEHIIWGTDAGWVHTPSYSRQRPLGSDTDVVTTLAIGSAERTFEIYLSEERFTALEMLLNSAALLTDWGRPIPDSRMAFLSEVTPVEDAISYIPGGISKRKRRTRLVFVSA